MGMFDQLKMAQEMMKNIPPDQLKELMKQAGDSKRAMEEMVQKLVTEEIQKRGLIGREEVARMIAESK